MNIRFNRYATILVSFAEMDYEDVRKEYIADYLLGKLDKNIVISNSLINERQTLIDWLPFIDHIFLYSDEDVILDKNEIAITFKNDVSDMVIMKVSDEFYNFLLKLR